MWMNISCNYLEHLWKHICDINDKFCIANHVQNNFRFSPQKVISSYVSDWDWLPFCSLIEFIRKRKRCAWFSLKLAFISFSPVAFVRLKVTVAKCSLCFWYCLWLPWLVLEWQNYAPKIKSNIWRRNNHPVFPKYGTTWCRQIVWSQVKSVK